MGAGSASGTAFAVRRVYEAAEALEARVHLSRSSHSSRRLAGRALPRHVLLQRKQSRVHGLLRDRIKGQGKGR